MKKVILVTGPRTALKSTVSRNLQSDLGIMVYQFDEIKKIITGLDTEAKKEKPKYFQMITADLINKLIVDTLAVHEYVILEMTYHEAYYFRLVSLCNDHGFELITVFMTGDPDVLYERYLKRVKYSFPKDEEEVLDVLAFRDTMMPIKDTYDQTNILTVDTTTFGDQDYIILMHQIVDKLEWTLSDSSI